MTPLGFIACLLAHIKFHSTASDGSFIGVLLNYTSIFNAGGMVCLGEYWSKAALR